MAKYPFLRIAHLAFWLLYGLAEHLSHIMYGQNHWQGSLFAPLTTMICTGLVALFFEKVQVNRLFKAGAILLMGFITVLVAHNLSRVLHYHITPEELLNMTLTDWLSGSSYVVLLLLTWAGLYISAYIYLEKRSQQQELEHIRNTARDAQLQQLRYQLNPHFLFNVLNSIDVSILDKQNQTAHEMLSRLSQFLRSTLEHKFDNKITLAQELAILQHYVEIEQQRFFQKIEFEKQIEPGVMQAYMPPMLLQPLVENAIKFSWQRGENSKISLLIHRQNHQLCIMLQNRFDPDKAKTNKGTGIGLSNVRDRLTLLYGDNGKLKTSTEQDQFRVSIHLPMELEI